MRLFVLQQTVTFPGTKRKPIISYLDYTEDMGSLGVERLWTSNLNEAHLFQADDDKDPQIDKPRNSRKGDDPQFRYDVVRVNVTLAKVLKGTKR